MFRRILSHRGTCILVGMGLGFMLAPEIMKVPLVNKLPQI